MINLPYNCTDGARGENGVGRKSDTVLALSPMKTESRSRRLERSLMGSPVVERSEMAAARLSDPYLYRIRRRQSKSFIRILKEN